MKRNVSKQTLSFSTSKSMKYLRTPVDIWKNLKQEFNFTLDACASHKNHLVDKYYTIDENCLIQDWTGEVVYCHPLFDMHIGRFVQKCATEKCISVMLLPASTHTRYFHQFIWDKEKHQPKPNAEVRFLEKPNKGFRFLNDDGSEDDISKIGYIKPLMIIIFNNMCRCIKTKISPIRVKWACPYCKNKIAETETQGAMPSFNMGLEVPTSSPPKSNPSDLTSPNPNIMFNFQTSLYGLEKLNNGFK